MKLVLSLLVTVVLGPTLLAQSPTSSPENSALKVPPNMESFMVVLLVRPPNAPQMAKEKLDQLQEAHIANIKRMHADGKLLKAGPFEDYSGRDVRGMYIFNAQTKEQVQEWVATDPLVKAGRLTPEYLKWFVEKGSLK